LYKKFYNYLILLIKLTLLYTITPNKKSVMKSGILYTRKASQVHGIIKK